MLSCKTMRRLIDENWVAVAPPRSGFLIVEVESLERAEAWASFFRGNKPPQRPPRQQQPQPPRQMRLECLDLTLALSPGLEEFAAFAVEPLRAAIADSCGGSLSELTLGDTCIPTRWLARFSDLRRLELALDWKDPRAGQLGEGMASVLNMDFK